MHAGGVFLAPTLQTLKRKGMLKLAGEEGHIVIVSNDGIPQEFDAIRKGEADATVSQPADLYAKYGLHVPQGGDRRGRRSPPARPTTTAPSSRWRRACSRTSSPRRWSPRRTSTTRRSGATSSDPA